jgi:hypothetical protein
MVQFRVQAIPEWSEPELNPELFNLASGGGPLLVQLPSFSHPHPCPPSHTQSVLLLHIGLLVGTSILQLSETLKCSSFLPCGCR